MKVVPHNNNQDWVAVLMQMSFISCVHGEIQSKVLRYFFHFQAKQHVR